MAVMRFGVRTGAVLMRGMYMGILAKEMCICVQKESVSKSLPKTSQEREGCQILEKCYNRVTPGMETIRSGV